ncbi:response regulator transcription factor [Parvibacter caecicola]|uniref:response regulator transcription factor n=1 Tax=Parvibacter caecicola TaxID=747645 RepID=UPI00272F9670|nr:helix-turn-helix transcriptional regulator [Parvibacter caecicola]
MPHRGAYYGLTEREIDVMHLFATGRTAARVREELVISAGTVNTHALHIYQKMDVHSRQELIEKVAAADLDAMVR